MDVHPGASRIAKRRKPGRPFKTASDKPAPRPRDRSRPLLGLMAAASATGMPPALPYRSFRIALGVFKQQDALPERLDRSAFSNKLHNTNVREIVEAFRFLGLIDSDQAPTPAFTSLVAAVGEPSWPETLRSVLEQSYHHLLACDPIAVTGGLHRAFRLVYDAGSENTRRRTNFFLHACREAANADTESGAGGEMLKEMPAYDLAWPDDVKRQWFGTFHDLVQRLNS